MTDATRTWDRLLDSLRVLRLRFEMESTSRFWLADWPGSMLRGALGTCLKALEDETSTSAYGELYRERGALEGRDGDAETDTPRPYVIEWPPGTGRILAAGDRFSFDIVLLGPAIAHARTVIAGVGRAAEAGLGTQRSPHRLMGVRVVEGGASGLPLQEVPVSLPSALPPSLDLVASTPLMLNRAPTIARQPTAEMLLTAGLRRLRQIVAAHGDVPISPYRLENDLRGSLDHVVLDASRMRWVESERDSRTASRKVRLGGLVGLFTLRGDLQPLRPLLHGILVLHVGRQVSQGQGRIGVALASEAAPEHGPRTSVGGERGAELSARVM